MKLFEFFEHKNNRLQLNELNLVNLDTVQQVVDAYANMVQTPEAKQWFQKNVRNFLVNSPKDNEQLSTNTPIPDNAPEWLKKAKESGIPLFNFKIDNQTKGELDHIADWLDSENAKPILPKLFKVTVPQAVEMSHKWTKAINKKASAKEDEEGVKEFLTFKDGYRWVQLTTQQCLSREGKLMNHCVGGDRAGGEKYPRQVAQGITQIYSLRDPKNDPHVTVEVTHNEVKQIKGRDNNAPVQKYIPHVQQFLAKLNVKVDPYDLKNMGLIYIENKLYNLYKLPDGLHVRGDLNLMELFKWKDEGSYRLPANLTVDGTLNASQMSMKQLPENWTIGKDLMVGDCANLVELPKTLKVGRSLEIYQTKITEVPDNLNNLFSLLAARSLLKKLPDTFVVKEKLDIGNTPLEQLPNRLTVGHMKLQDTKIKQLPEGIVVTKLLDVSGSQLQSFPQKYRIARIDGLDQSLVNRIPANINAGVVRLNENSKIETIGENVTFEELKLDGEHLIHELPKTMKCKKLFIRNNVRIKEIPTLKCDTITLIYTAVEKLGPGTIVNELLLKANNHLKTLPDDLQVADRIVVYDKDKEFIKWLKKTWFADKLHISG